MLGTFSGKLARTPGLTALLGEDVVHLRSTRDLTRHHVDTLVGWGLRPSTSQPRQIAAQRGLKFLSLEDGFLRAFGTGATHPTLSLVVDPEGIYYDATRPSALEAMLASPANLLTGAGSCHQEARARILQLGLSKYNAAADMPHLEDGAVKRVLVVDQTRGDASLTYGEANEDSFRLMLSAAQAEHPGATIYVKTHPEVIRGDKGGFYQDLSPTGPIRLLREPSNPVRLLEQMDHVYVATSHLGFEALLLGKTVTCFGVPWYSGWGATDDRQQCSRRQRKRSVDELFAAAYLHYTRYLNPEMHERGTIFDVIDWLARQRSMHARQTGRSIAIGFRRWKAHNVEPLLGLDAKAVHFVHNVQAAARLNPTSKDRLVVWGANPSDEIRRLTEHSGASLQHMEDGFIRSVGLGSDFIPPRSLVLDSYGLYFDARQASGLERLLNEREFSDEDRQRAKVVRSLIVDHQLTKYNIEPTETPCWNPGDKRIVLVPGQVEDDASIRFGCGPVADNLALLRAARASRPDAYIVYKPHPDVTVRNRKGKLQPADALNYADHIETSVSIVNCVEHCHEVHTMTSLSGFEGLLRGKHVVTYGSPFYSGWGLTEDQMTVNRRMRSLTLDELIAGALLHYPIYWDWTLKGYTSCEAVLRQIIHQRDLLTHTNRLASVRKTYFQRQWHKVKLWAKAGFLVKR